MVSVIFHVLPTATAALLGLLAVYFRFWRRVGKREAGSNHATPSVGLLHPAAGGGGGGERVLWVALSALIDADRRCGISRSYVLYTARYPNTPGVIDDAKDTEHLLRLVHQQFNVTVDPSRIEVVYITHAQWLDPARYPRLTLILQSFVGGFAMFLDVARAGATDVVVDTVGIPFSYYLLVLFCGCRVASYTHYPIISTDMIGKVQSRTSDFNNEGSIARSGLLSTAKLYYYRAFAVMYRWFAGCWVSVIMTNSSWTNNHIRHVWATQASSIVYPPCNTKRFSSLPIDPATRDNLIVSIGQFRPEKNHELQLRAFAQARSRLPKGTRLAIVGGARNAADQQRVEALKAVSQELGVTAHVDFEVSVPFARIVDLLGRATTGLHTMRDEHFGIVVAEYMAAGAVPIAHNSAGPKEDIVHRAVDGYLCTTQDEFATAMVQVFTARTTGGGAAWRDMALAGRKSSARFSDAFFARTFCMRLAPLLALTLLPDETDESAALCC